MPAAAGAGHPHAARAPYGGTTAAARNIISASSHIGIDMVQNVTGNLIEVISGMSYIDYMTARIPLARVGEPPEVAALICWLASEEMSFSTGACYDISGGRATY